MMQELTLILGPPAESSTKQTYERLLSLIGKRSINADEPFLSFQKELFALLMQPDEWGENFVEGWLFVIEQWKFRVRKYEMVLGRYKNDWRACANLHVEPLPSEHLQPPRLTGDTAVALASAIGLTLKLEWVFGAVIGLESAGRQVP